MLSVLVVCLLLGALYGLTFVELSDLLRDSYRQIPNVREDVVQGLRAVEPFLSRAVVGMLLFGVTAYVIVRSSLGLFARGLLGEMMGMLRAKQFLPYTFKLARKTSLRYTHENLLSLFEAYVTKLQESDNDKQKYQGALERYADPAVAGALKYQSAEFIIKSSRKRVAVLFADIRGFTPMTECLMPEEVVEVLNQHFAASTAAITRNGGKVNKFIGDAVMALFDEPPAYKDGASATRNAIQAGLEMQEKWSMLYPQWHDKLTNPIQFGLGVGVHTGTVILGNIGSDERLEYTAIGDTVNLTARICGLAKHGQVLVSEEGWSQVVDQFDMQPRDPVAIKGKTGLYTTYVVSHKIPNR